MMPGKFIRTFFVILFEGRTGSSHVVSCLNSHPDIICYPEVLGNLDPQQQRSILNCIIQNKPIKNDVSFSDIARYFHTDAEKNATVSGFKCKLYQPYILTEFYEFVHMHQFKLIYLKRRNIVKSVVSLLNARRLKNRYGHLNAEKQHHIQGALHVSPASFAKELQRRIRIEEAHQKFFDACQVQKEEFLYEDLIKMPDIFFKTLLNFLSVPPKRLHGKFYKNTPDNLREAIENFSEIQTLLKGTSFEPMLLE